LSRSEKPKTCEITPLK